MTSQGLVGRSRIRSRRTVRPAGGAEDGPTGQSRPPRGMGYFPQRRGLRTGRTAGSEAAAVAEGALLVAGQGLRDPPGVGQGVAVHANGGFDPVVAVVAVATAEAAVVLPFEEVDEPVELAVVDPHGDVAEGLHLVETEHELVEVAVVAPGGVGPHDPLDPGPVHLPAGQLELVVAHGLVDGEVLR